MRISLMGVALWLTLVMLVSLARASEERLNESVARGLILSAAEDEGDLFGKVDADNDKVTLKDNGEFEDGFSSLDGMLQWAIGHSDPDKLKETAEDVKRLSPEELKKRQIELKELLDKLKTPSDAQLMQIAINDLKNSSLSLEEHLRALEELLILVEPIDNANDLNKLGGLAVIISELDNAEAEIRKLSAWVIGKASQNNPVVQKQALDLGALKKLMKMVRSAFAEEAIKALYAVSALIRNNLDGQRVFFAEAGDLMLQEILNNSSFDIRLRRKSIYLVSDLAECQRENTDRPELPLFTNWLFLKSVVELTASSDLDLLEKALDAIKNLLQLRTTEAVIFRDFCGLHEALGRTQIQLQKMMEEEDQREYAVNLKSLHREVELLFHDKLEKDQTKTGSAFKKAEAVLSGMLAKGFMLGKDAINTAKAFDEKHQLTSTTSAKVASFDKKFGLNEKISMATDKFNDKIREVDQKFQVSEKTKSAFAVAEEKVSDAGSAIIRNRYVHTGAMWVTGAFNMVAKAAEEVSQKTKEKIDMAEGERKRKVVDDFAQVHLSETDSAIPVDTEPNKPVSPKFASNSPSEHLQDPSKHETEPKKGLIL